jgi:hypothetical protein
MVVADYVDHVRPQMFALQLTYENNDDGAVGILS